MLRVGPGRRGCGARALTGAGYSQQWRHDFNATTDAGWYLDGTLTMQDQHLTGQTETPVSVGNDVLPEATIVYAGARSLKCVTDAKTGVPVPKAHVSREGWVITQGETVHTTFQMYVPSGLTSYDNTFFWDIEVNGNYLDDPAITTYFGLRLALNASRCVKVDREYTSGADPADGVVAIATNTWTAVAIELYCHSTAGTLTVTFNGVTAFSATGFNTLPTAAQVNAEFLTAVTTAPWYDMAQLGITANGHATAAKTAYFDAWWMGVTGP